MSKAATWSILLVDDDEVVLTLIGNILESRGLDVVSTAALRRSVKAARASLAVMPTRSRRSLQ
jgi:CheY-like chemotaxis protein